jgi:hypothetical protein
LKLINFHQRFVLLFSKLRSKKKPLKKALNPKKAPQDLLQLTFCHTVLITKDLYCYSQDYAPKKTLKKKP